MNFGEKEILNLYIKNKGIATEVRELLTADIHNRLNQGIHNLKQLWKVDAENNKYDDMPVEIDKKEEWFNFILVCEKDLKVFAKEYEEIVSFSGVTKVLTAKDMETILEKKGMERYIELITNLINDLNKLKNKLEKHWRIQNRKGINLEQLSKEKCGDLWVDWLEETSHILFAYYKLIVQNKLLTMEIKIKDFPNEFPNYDWDFKQAIKDYFLKTTPRDHFDSNDREKIEMILNNTFNRCFKYNEHLFDDLIQYIAKKWR